MFFALCGCQLTNQELEATVALFDTMMFVEFHQLSHYRATNSEVDQHLGHVSFNLHEVEACPFS